MGERRSSSRRGPVALLFLALLAAGLGACDRGRRDGGGDGLVSTGLGSSRRASRTGSAAVTPVPVEPAPQPDPPPNAPDVSTGAPDGSAAPDFTEAEAGEGRPSSEDPVAAAARELLEHGDTLAWRREAALEPEDLTIRVRSEVRREDGELVGLAGFNLRDVNGFRDSPKCNLFVFELAFRAGFVVPLVGRHVGWGFPSSDMIGADAADGHIAGSWARVVRRPDARGLNLDRENGHAVVAVGTSAIGGTPGHMALIDWVDRLELTREGDVRLLDFLGWEANVREGARYGRMHWATPAVVPRARFLAIHVLDLRAAEPGHEVAVLGDGPLRPTEVMNLEGQGGE